MSTVSIIAAIQSSDRGLGFKGKVPWKIPEDVARFKALTVGHPVVMGRKTWESLPKKFRPLPDRTNIVISRRAPADAGGATWVNSIQAALSAAWISPGGNDRIWVIGGAEVYALALPYADDLYLTVVDAHEPCDAFFPEGYRSLFPEVLGESPLAGFPARFLRLGR